MTPHDPTRRALLAALAAAPAAMLGARPTVAQGNAAASAGLISTNVCLLGVDVTEGPFYLDRGMVRADVTEGRSGLPLEMAIQIVDASCRPIRGARVDIWHCDALGVYSNVAGQDTAGETFLRGTQMADERGVVIFRTIYPGWYRGRTTHIHHKVYLDDTNVLTGQIFFPDALSQRIYDQMQPYAGRRAERDTFNGNDGIARRAGPGAFAGMEAAGDGYRGSLVIGVDPQATSRSA